MQVVNHYAHLLMLMTFLPLLAGLVVLLCSPLQARAIALGGTLATLAASLILVCQTGTFVTPETITAGYAGRWIHNLNIHVELGMDGLSGAMVLLTNVLSVISILCAWRAVPRRRKEFFFFLLVLQTGVLGTFLSLDLILFYIFWETMMIPNPGRDQVHAVQLRRLRRDAAGDSWALCAFQTVDGRGGHLLATGIVSNRASNPRDGARLAFPRFFPGLRDQDPALSAA
jgi:hypothetical protein